MTVEFVLLRIANALTLARAGEEEPAWSTLEPLFAHIEAGGGRPVALALVEVLAVGELDVDRRLAAAGRLLTRWRTDTKVLAALALRCESLVNLRYLNAAPPEDPFFEDLAHALADAGDVASDADRRPIASALATVARICGRRWDPACEQAHQTVLALRGSWQDWYNYGLFLKSRGRFAEGLVANTRARDAGGAEDDAVRWNLGICATGAGDGAAALEVWRSLGHRVSLGTDGLPTGGWPMVEVRLAERPGAARTAEDEDPGEEETVWVTRLSACHGRVESPTYQDLGVDYGDLVLFDGAAILFRDRGGERVPVFPHLVTLRSGGWTTIRFTGRQDEPGAIEAMKLPNGAFLYSHTERVRNYCRACWEKGKDAAHEHTESAHTVVTGKLVVPPGGDLRALAAHLSVPSPVTLLVPELWRKLGLEERARLDAVRARQLTAEG